jgi:hypothetical protein
MIDEPRGLFDHLVQAHHISAGMGITFPEAMEIVKAAAEEIEARSSLLDSHSEPQPPTTIGNVTFVDFRSRR